MKKLCFVFTIIIFFSTSPAQIFCGYGLKAGTTISNQVWKYSNNYFSFDVDSRTGFNIGIFSEFLDLPSLSIVAEVNYTQKGMRKELPVTTVQQPYGTGEYITWDTRFDYINISALGKLRFNAGLFTPYIILGPKIDFEINKVNTLGTNIVEYNFLQINFNKNRYGFKAGIGTEINLSFINLLTEILYDSDFNELSKNESLKIKSNSFDLRVGIIL